MGEWEEVWVYYSEMVGVRQVDDAEGTLEPELWVVDHGVENYPDAIYFFANLVPKVITDG